MPEIASWLVNHGFSPNIRTLSISTATAQDAALAIGCQVGQIAKSLIFYDVETDDPILIIASGANRVDKQKVGEYLKIKIKTASPEYVLAKTGIPVGGVPPIGHIKPLKTLIDADLMQYNVIYAAAGTDHTIFPIPPQTLQQLSSAEVIVIC